MMFYNNNRSKEAMLCLLLFLTGSIAWGQERYLPSRQGKVVEHRYYSLDFSTEHHQAYWVYYTLSGQNLTGEAKRTDDFRVDPLLGTACATLADYRRSDYDRGHLCPAADMSFSTRAMSETFYLSNMSPQAHGFNAGIWKRLEEHVRERAKGELLHVVTGPVFRANRGTIGKNEVTVPGYFYKLFYAPARQQMVAYVVPHRASRQSLSTFAVPVDSVERLTGIDFFPGLPDELETLLEADTLPHAGTGAPQAAPDKPVTATAKSTPAAQQQGTHAKQKAASPHEQTAATPAPVKKDADTERPSARQKLLMAGAVVALFLLWRALRHKPKKSAKPRKRRRH